MPFDLFQQIETKSFIERCLDRLEEEYRYAVATAGTVNPPKTSIVLEQSGGTLTRFISGMVGALSTGESGGKIIHVDDVTGEQRSRTIVFGKNGELLLSVDSERLTRFRCALMAMLGIKLFYGGRNLKSLSIGMIGTGRINLETVRAIKTAWGIGG